ncbi:alpha/beta hydrolase [Streptomyces sp. NPDC004528]|uniref:alpha/beta fold hydrolase n=1 Tax=Streptomyces sp. NPDC004528 TaxID=3154550 RepID=UPI0033AB57A7
MASTMQSREHWIAGGTRQSFSGFHGTVFLRQDGPVDGHPVTLLHGFPTSSHDWAAIVPDLAAAGHRVTTADFLGFGESDKPYPHDYSIFEQANLIEAVWDFTGSECTALVAHDYGVSVGQELLARNPDRITSMTWLNGGIFPDLHRPIPEQKLLSGPAGAEAAEQLDEEKFIISINRLIGERPLPQELLHDMWLSARARDGLRVFPLILHYMEERRENSVRWTDALRSYGGPEQFIWGPADPISGAHVIPRIREVAPQAKLTVLDGNSSIGHFPQIEAAEIVGPMLTDWLNSTWAARMG